MCVGGGGGRREKEKQTDKTGWRHLHWLPGHVRISVSHYWILLKSLYVFHGQYYKRFCPAYGPLSVTVGRNWLHWRVYVNSGPSVLLTPASLWWNWIEHLIQNRNTHGSRFRTFYGCHTDSGGLQFRPLGFHYNLKPGFDTAQDCQCHVSSVTSPTGCTEADDRVKFSQWGYISYREIWTPLWPNQELEHTELAPGPNSRRPQTVAARSDRGRAMARRSRGPCRNTILGPLLLAALRFRPVYGFRPQTLNIIQIIYYSMSACALGPIHSHSYGPWLVSGAAAANQVRP